MRSRRTLDGIEVGVGAVDSLSWRSWRAFAAWKRSAAPGLFRRRRGAGRCASPIGQAPGCSSGAMQHQPEQNDLPSAHAMTSASGRRLPRMLDGRAFVHDGLVFTDPARYQSRRVIPSTRPTTPLTVKNARFTRLRSLWVNQRCSQRASRRGDQADNSGDNSSMTPELGAQPQADGRLSDRNGQDVEAACAARVRSAIPASWLERCSRPELAVEVDILAGINQVKAGDPEQLPRPLAAMPERRA